MKYAASAKETPRHKPLWAWIIATMGLLSPAPAFAEAPMQVDDAGTLDQGGKKIESVWRKDDRQKGVELLFGFSPLEHLELEIAAARDRDGSAAPATRLNGTALGVKWVPIQNDTGWSFGVKLDVGRTRIEDRETPQKFTQREISLNGLASYRYSSGQTVHLNLGTARTRALGEHVRVATWGAGYEHPLTAKLKLATEIFGQEHSRPDTALGLRYEVFDGFKISASLGRGNDRHFGQAGFAWEF